MSGSVLIGIIGRRKDLDILLREKWYRIPAVKCPRQKFSWLAFYQTSNVEKTAKQIKYYAKVEPKRVRICKRLELLPDEPYHIRAGADYYKFEFDRIKRLRKPVTNKIGMRMTFGFTTLARLLRFRSVPNLFGVKPLERIFRRILKKNGIPFTAEYSIISKRRIRYRLDLAVFCKNGKINIECDNPKFHSGHRHDYDMQRNRFLQRLKWRVLRFTDEDILLNPNGCLRKLKGMIKRLGGV